MLRCGVTTSELLAVYDLLPDSPDESRRDRWLVLRRAERVVPLTFREPSEQRHRPPHVGRSDPAIEQIGVDGVVIETHVAVLHAGDEPAAFERAEVVRLRVEAIGRAERRSQVAD